MNAFEIRLELLKLAREILNEEYFGKRSKADAEWTLKSNDFVAGKITQSPEYDLPKSVTVKDILNTADELNSFVSKG